MPWLVEEVISTPNIFSPLPFPFFVVLSLSVLSQARGSFINQYSGELRGETGLGVCMIIAPRSPGLLSPSELANPWWGGGGGSVFVSNTSSKSGS